MNKVKIQKEQMKDLENLFIEDFRNLMRLLYKKHLSEAVKRGIREAKKKKKQ